MPVNGDKGNCNGSVRSLPPQFESSHDANATVPSWYATWKPRVEFLLALLLVVPALPLIGVAAILIKLTSRGRVIYTQTRLGLHGKPYTIYKLRTMVQHSEAGRGAVWAAKGDPRITRVGKILRALHIDELPQLLNILKGDMSLVGPRPERPEIVEFLTAKIDRYSERLQVRPGITGLAQVQLPPDVSLDDVRRKLVCDLYYIEHLSAWADCRILACTGFYALGIPLGFFRHLLHIPEPLKQPAMEADTRRVSAEDVEKSASLPGAPVCVFRDGLFVAATNS